MKRIKLTQGKYTLVDNEDFEWLNQFKWYLKKGYAIRNKPVDGNGKRGTLFMHRVILNINKNIHIS